MDGELSDNQIDAMRKLVDQDPSGLEQIADQLILDSLLAEELGTETLTSLVDLIQDSESLSDFVAVAKSETKTWFASSFIQIRKSAGWLATAALLMIAVFIMGRWNSSALASPSSLVRAALLAHLEPIERVYVVTTDRSESWLNTFLPPRDVKITTQGNRFWVNVNRGDKSWQWGRSVEGKVWMTLGPRRAIQIDADEVDSPLQHITDVYSLELESLLNNALKNAQLTYSEKDDFVDTINATPSRRWRGKIQSVDIDIDRETKLVRRLVIDRETVSRGTVTMTFTLVDSRPADESLYQPEGHLLPPFQIYSSLNDPDLRRETLTTWLGSIADRFIKSREIKNDDKE